MDLVGTPSKINRVARADFEVIIAKIAKNLRENVHITIGVRKGHAYVGLRIWVKGKHGAPIPTPRGINFAPDKIRDLIKGLNDVLSLVRLCEDDAE